MHAKEDGGKWWQRAPGAEEPEAMATETGATSTGRDGCAVQQSVHAVSDSVLAGPGRSHALRRRAAAAAGVPPSSAASQCQADCLMTAALPPFPFVWHSSLASNMTDAGAIKPSPKDFVEFNKLVGCVRAGSLPTLVICLLFFFPTAAPPLLPRVHACLFSTALAHVCLKHITFYHVMPL